jgi:hypothetical protein
MPTLVAPWFLITLTPVVIDIYVSGAEDNFTFIGHALYCCNGTCAQSN